MEKLYFLSIITILTIILFVFFVGIFSLFNQNKIVSFLKETIRMGTIGLYILLIVIGVIEIINWVF